MNIGGFVVIAEFELFDGKRIEFLSYANENAQGVVTNEPDCRHFDILTSDENPNLVVLHEVYKNKAAFEAHLTQPHYLKYSAGVFPLVKTKTVRFFTQQV